MLDAQGKYVKKRLEREHLQGVLIDVSISLPGTTSSFPGISNTQYCHQLWNPLPLEIQQNPSLSVFWQQRQTILGSICQS